MSSASTNRVPRERTGGGYAERKARVRSRARQRAASRVVRPVSDSMRSWDLPAGEGAARSGLRLAAYVAIAVFVHAGLVVGLIKLGGEAAQKPVRVIEKVIVRTIDIPDWPKEDEEPRLEEAPPEEAPEPELAAKVPEPPRAKKKFKREVAKADPVDVRPEPVAEPPKPRRRVVGISMESTVSGGAGPAFAVGNTRMGRTQEKAEDPGKVEKLAPARTSRVGSREVGPNRVASSLPVDGAKLKKPKRIGAANLSYPPHLKAKGIDGDVVVLVRITTVGSVAKVKVVKSSGYPEFDEAARRAATKERYQPATRGGEPVEYSLKYTYRFRVKDA